ncbi:unnamed protein product [Arctogadus glacialis]
MDALKEIPALVKCVRDLITTMKRMPPVMDTDRTSSGSSSPAPEMISLGNTGVQVSKTCFKRLNRTRMKTRAYWNSERAAKPEKLSALVDAVIAEFPGTNVSDVNFVSKKKQ